MALSARWLVYPALVGGSLLLLWAALVLGASLAWAPYAVIAITGPLVILAERKLPYRPEWHASWSDIVDDGLYLFIVQVILPLALAWTVVWIVSAKAAGDVVLVDIWPSHLPIWAQLVLKIMIGDFLRYWLHRAAHTWTPLWRLHAVHHQPEKLYTTNVFRFHPAEKALQFMLDTLPFMLVGIGTEVLAYYFVFYSMSGLFQHSNCDVRLGWFNYVISGPEVHRWHHSVKVAEFERQLRAQLRRLGSVVRHLFPAAWRYRRSPRPRGAELPPALPRTAARAVPLPPGRVR